MIQIKNSLWWLIFSAKPQLFSGTVVSAMQEILPKQVPATGDGELLQFMGLLFAGSAILLLILLLIAFRQQKRKK